MLTTTKNGFFVFLLLIFNFGCSPKNDPSQNLGSGGPAVVPLSAKPLTFLTLSGDPLVGAQVLVGNTYSSESLILTNDLGQINPPEGWTEPKTITISATGSILTSFLKQLPEGQIFKVRQMPRKANLTLKGGPKEFTVVNLDDKADFGILFSRLERRDLFLFDIAKLLSPETDEVSLPLGQKLDVPTNLSLPQQTEKYGIIKLTLNKPQYRLFFEDFGEVPVVSLKGSFPFNKTIKDAQNSNQIYKIVNNFSFTSGDFQNVAFKTNLQSFNYGFSDFVINQKVPVSIPQFTKDYAAFTIAGFNRNGVLVPTDIKSFETPGVVSQLSTANQTNRFVITALKRKSEMQSVGQVSVGVNPVDESGTLVQPTLLPLILAPVVSSKYLIQTTPPTVGGLTPVGSYFYLSQILPSTTGVPNSALDTEPIWDVVSGEFESTVKLPEWPLNTSLEKRKWKWSSSFLANEEPVIVQTIDDLNQVTHSTYNETVFDSE